MSTGRERKAGTDSRVYAVLVGAAAQARVLSAMVESAAHPVVRIAILSAFVAQSPTLWLKRSQHRDKFKRGSDQNAVKVETKSNALDVSARNTPGLLSMGEVATLSTGGPSVVAATTVRELEEKKEREVEEEEQLVADSVV